MAQPTKDHQLPKSRGGKGRLNLVLACQPCNQEKANMDVETYRWFLQDKKPLGKRVKFYGESWRTWRENQYLRELENLPA
jgi:5-methylcytosine-specific restriction endonuclease McrA